MGNFSDILIILGPTIIGAILSYLAATKKARTEIFVVKEATNREIESIKADTEREIETIKAKTESQIKIMESKSKSKEDELVYQIVLERFVPLLLEPKKLEEVIKLGDNPSPEEIVSILNKD